MALEDTYALFKTNPEDKAVLKSVVNELQPTINYALTSLNATNDPVLKVNAKVIAADAVKSYDPSYGASLETHVTHNLQKLGRIARKHRSPIQLPERQQLEGYALKRAEEELLDKTGRDPDVSELADYTGFSVKKITELRKPTVAVVTEAALDGSGGVETPDYMTDAMDYIHIDSDYKDRKILEHMFGYGGSTILPANELAAKLKTHPSQITRRTAKMKIKLHELVDALERQ
jgi:DNA-directed RNA polymerase specialized sigma subunit